MIGIFDSGLGGLTVTRQILSAFGHEDIYYLADTAHSPYGNKSIEEIVHLSYNCTQFLVDQGIDVLVIACNSATAASLPILRNHFSIPIIGIIEPTAYQALLYSSRRTIGVLATQATVSTHAYKDALTALTDRVPSEYRQGIPERPECALRVVEQAAPLFVPLIERGITYGKQIYQLAQFYCEKLLEYQVDTVILGCTHYPFISNVLRDVFDDKVTLLNSGSATVEVLRSYIPGHSTRDSAQLLTENILPSDSPWKISDSISASLSTAQPHAIHNVSSLRAETGDAPEYIFACTGDITSFSNLCIRYFARYTTQWSGTIRFVPALSH